jgi:Xaa-Pro aminopeptidase
MTDSRIARQAHVVEQLQARHLDALVITHLPSIRWLTGFTGSAGVLLATPTRCTLVTDFRYAVQAPQEVGAAGDVVIERANVWGRVERLVRDGAGSRVGYESHVLPGREVQRISAWLPGGGVPVAALVEELRQVKDAGEVASIRAAGDLAMAALEEILPTIRLGEREIDVAARLEAALRVRGSEWHPFETIVASGPRAALPHARTSERVLAASEFLLIDFGAKVDGYCSDDTRTVALGRADERQRTVYELVREAQRRAREGVRGGMTGVEADALAREVIAARGFGEAFGHSLGHGLGLEVHEAPRLASTAKAPLPVGAVVTVEPGIYLPGWGGVRLEDDVWLSPDGPVLLTDGRTDLIELDA